MQFATESNHVLISLSRSVLVLFTKFHAFKGSGGPHVLCYVQSFGLFFGQAQAAQGSCRVLFLNESRNGSRCPEHFSEEQSLQGIS